MRLLSFSTGSNTIITTACLHLSQAWCGSISSCGTGWAWNSFDIINDDDFVGGPIRVNVRACVRACVNAPCTTFKSALCSPFQASHEWYDDFFWFAGTHTPFLPRRKTKINILLFLSHHQYSSFLSFFLSFFLYTPYPMALEGWDVRIGNKYKLGKKIGAGSFGEIYLGKLYPSTRKEMCYWQFLILPH